MTTTPILVLWDIDRTLLYVGHTDQQVYRDVFAEIVGRPAEHLPERGTGFTMARAARSLLTENGVPEDQADELLPKVLDRMPQVLAGYAEQLRTDGVLMPGAVDALKAVQADPQLVATIVSENLKASAVIKLDAFGLTSYVDVDLGGYSSDDAERSHLVAVSQRRAGERHNTVFTPGKTVIIGDCQRSHNSALSRIT